MCGYYTLFDIPKIEMHDIYPCMTGVEFHPKRKKLKGYQKVRK